MLKRTFCILLSLVMVFGLMGAAMAAEEEEEAACGVLLFQGHGSVRITTPEGKVIYVDPYAGEGYDLPADLILVTHQHPDHNKVDLIENRSEDCQIITQAEALEGGEHQTFDLGYVTVEAVEAGYNGGHDVKSCVGYVLTLSDGVKVYLSGDTSKTEQMPEMKDMNIDYAFFCCDGRFNMDRAEASECAELVGARHSIPYHMAPGSLYDEAIAEEFQAEGRILLPAGEELVLLSAADEAE